MGNEQGMRCGDCQSRTPGGNTCADCPWAVPTADKAPSVTFSDRLTEEDLLAHTPVVDVAEADYQVTRYLCCAAESDPMFAQNLVAHIIRQPRRGIAMSPGLDVVGVLRHACAARRRRAIRDCVLTAVNLPLTLVVLGSIISAALTVSLEPLALLPWAIGLSTIVSSLVLYLSKLHYYRVMTGALRRDRFSATTAPEPRSPLLRSRLRQIADLTRGNTTIYQGFKPFRGYGKVIGGWSFAIDLTKPRIEGTIPELFDVHDIRTYVKSQVEALKWLGLTVEDRVFVSGRDVPNDSMFIQSDGRPRPGVDQVHFNQLLAAPDKRARPYMVIRLLGWDGELALTIFLRFVMVKKNLFIEASHSILTPLQDSFRKYDKIEPVSSVSDHMRLFFSCLRPFSGIVSGFTHLSEYRDDRRALAPNKRGVDRQDFDHGAFFSIREWASDSRYQRYFQKLDSEMYTKVVEQRIFDSLVQFLDSRNIDTGELIQRQTTIMNNGVMVTGNSSITADSVAAGNNAQAISHGDHMGRSGRADGSTRR